MSLKMILKKIYLLSKKKEVIPILQPISESKILYGKKALIVGGTGGIGSAIAKEFIRSGAHCIIAGTNKTKLEGMDLFSDTEFKNSAEPLVINLNDTSSFSQIFSKDSVIQKCGEVDILVNAAGVHTEQVSFLGMTTEEYDRVMNINLRGVFFLCQAFSDYLIMNKKKGHILLISSSRGSEPAWTPYGISKWALNGLTKGLAKELLPYGIIVNAIAPGSTATELLGKKSGDSIFTLDNGINRLALPEEICTYAKFLVSDAGNMLVGETIHISAGRGLFDVR